MGVVTIIASVSTIVLTGLATVGWVVFIGGFGAVNTEISFFERIDSLSPELREVAFLPYNSHYIVAVLSPILFIVMIVMSVLMMVLKNKWAAYINAIISIPVLILVAFVMISAGVVLYSYSAIITLNRLIQNTIIPVLSEGSLDTANTMFTGMFFEVLFLTGALIAVFFGAILAGREEK